MLPERRHEACVRMELDFLTKWSNASAQHGRCCTEGQSWDKASIMKALYVLCTMVTSK